MNLHLDTRTFQFVATGWVHPSGRSAESNDETHVVEVVVLHDGDAALIRVQIDGPAPRLRAGEFLGLTHPTVSHLALCNNNGGAALHASGVVRRPETRASSWPSKPCRH